MSTVPACTRQMVLVVVVVNSSSPSSPCTTSTLDRRAANTPAITSARSANAQPISPARGQAGLVSGPRRLNTVGIPSSRRTADACRYDGWKVGAKQNPIPTSARLRATCSGPRSMRTPSASSVSAPPDSDDAARLPCLTTGTPAAATTIAAMVDRLTVFDAVTARSDDVDGVVGHGVSGHLARVVEHDVGQLTDFGRGGNLHRHRHRESRDLSRAGIAGHDLVHGPGGLAPGQVLSVRQPPQHLRP